MTTLGSTVTPDTPTNYYRGRADAFYVGQMPENGALTSISVYAGTAGGQGNQNFAAGIYTSNDATFPDDFVVSGTSIAVDGIPGWKTISVSSSLISGQHIWICISAQLDQGANDLMIYGLNSGSPSNVRHGNSIVEYPSFPTPWVNDDTLVQNGPAGYITYSTIAVTISERLITLGNVPVANASGITAIIYAEIPTTSSISPHQIVEDLTTDESGYITFNISSIGLTEDDPIWLILMNPDSPFPGSIRKVIPTWSS